MERDEIIRMAREAGFSEQDAMGRPAFLGNSYDLERFAALVAEHWIETNKALAKEIIELKKQAEQEPVGYFAYDEEHDIWEELTGPNAPGATKLYAAHVRTKDLTDDEIYECYTSDAHENTPRSFARAIIQADREKNRG